MLQVLRQWFQRYFSDQQAILLVAVLLVVFGVVFYLGGMLMPVLVSVVLAYLLEGVVGGLERRGSRRMPAVILVFSFFFALTLFVAFGVLPPTYGQVVALIGEAPRIVEKMNETLREFPDKYPNYVTAQQVELVRKTIEERITAFGTVMVGTAFSTLRIVITLVIYLILVPLLVFFFLKDKDRICGWLVNFLPKQRSLLTALWQDLDRQTGNYVRGKFLEILIVGVAAFVIFALFGLQYAILLATLVGLSVIVPYVGAAIVTIPVAAVAAMQWGFDSRWVYLMVAYLVLQALDGNVLVPLLFSEVVKLHPVAIIVSVLLFGGLWGLWGVFFAIPLATLLNAMVIAWPRSPAGEEPGRPPDPDPKISEAREVTTVPE